jgi:bacteriocin biosynthesis cyclodehydratase domain-containing protein
LTSARGVPSQRRRAPRYRLRASVEYFPAAGGDVFLLRAGGAPGVVVRSPSAEDRRLLEALAHGGVEAAAGSVAERRLRPLLEAGLIGLEPDVSAMPAALAERFARQLPWLAEEGDAAAAQLSLRAAHVVILGCGGIGTWALGALAGLGIGRFTLVDDDVVELSNLNRQILYALGDVGEAKVDRAAAWLRRFDPGIRATAVRQRVRSAADVAALLGDADLLLLAADWPPYELGRWVNRACIEESVPFVLAGQQPPTLKVGPTYVPGDGPCFACHEARLAAAHPYYEELTEHRRRDPAPDVTLGPATGVVGSLLALDMLALLSGRTPATRGRALLIDMRTFEQRWEAVERIPDCPECGRLGQRGAPQGAP